MWGARVAPASPLPVPPVRARSRTFTAIAGVAYVAGAVAAGIYYLYLLRPSFSNDLWWPNYNISGYEAFLVDVLNQELATSWRVGDVDLLAPRMAMRKQYIATSSFTAVLPTYTRRLRLNVLTSPAFVIPSLRTMEVMHTMWLPTQLCWVDFKKVFEMAHTLRRQQRCLQRYSQNGAVYFEALVRNVAYDRFMAIYGGPDNVFTVSLQTALMATPAGQQWLASIATAADTTTVADELLYWSNHGISTFQLQWTNDRDPGLSESMLVYNALGMQLSVDLKNLATHVGPWTSIILSNYLGGDLYFARQYNASLLRGAANSLTTYASFESLLGLFDATGAYVNQTQLLRLAVGPLASIDAYYVALPPSLLAFNRAVNTIVYGQLLPALTAGSPVVYMPPLVLTPAPPAWTQSDLLYYGGSPLCLMGSGLPFVQAQLNYDDTCQTPMPLQMALQPAAVLFARLWTPTLSPSAICAVTMTSYDACMRYVHLADTIVAPSSLGEVSTVPAIADISALNISLLQFASTVDGTNWTLLTQPIVDTTPFAFFGAAFVYQWLIGQREVISLEGDSGTLVVMSEAYASTAYATSGGSHYIKNATQILYYITVYTSGLMTLVAAACIAAGAKDGVRGLNANLFAFSRVGGATWVGRSLLFLRGSTALLLLSTANVELQALGTTWSRFVLIPRSWLEIAVLASEGTWITYVMTEILVLAVPSVTAAYAPWSAATVWLIYTVLEAFSPVTLGASIDRKCTSSNMAANMQCTSMTLDVGRVSRLCWLYAIAGASVTAGIAVAIHRKQQLPRASPCVVSGLATSFIDWDLSLPVLQSAPTVASRIDRVACVLCGLLPFTVRQRQYTFDLNLWVVTEDTVATGRLRRNSHEVLEAIRSLRRLSTQMTNLLSGDTESDLRIRRWTDKLFVLGSVAYLGLSTFGSVTYLSFSQVALANDMAWATFSSTGIHAFLATYFNQGLLLRGLPSLLDLAGSNCSVIGTFVAQAATLTIPGNIGARYQRDRITTLGQAVDGLRSMGGCNYVWLMTPYCFVDFEQRWSLAHSTNRAERCTRMTSNGAVFLESVLRNLNYVDWAPCWGEAFDVGIAAALRESNSGQAWLDKTVDAPATTAAAEVAYWTRQGVIVFATQWQNFKTIGLHNHYAVENAYGTSFPFTLVATDGSYRFTSQTSFKMYWGFGNDLRWIMPNQSDHSDLYGTSFVTSSARYAFANASFSSALAVNGTVPSPVGPGFATIEAALGPFGTIDMHYVPVPQSLQTATALLSNEVRRVLRSNSNARRAYANITVTYNAMPAPSTWRRSNLLVYGGSPLCDAVPTLAVQPLNMTGLATLFSFDYGCYSTLYTTPLLFSNIVSLYALVMATTLGNWNTTATCAVDPANTVMCRESIAAMGAFASAYLVLPAMPTAAAAAAADIAALDVRLLQYTRANASAPMVLETIGLLEDAPFQYFAWAFLWHWVIGDHEVVTFEGDAGELTLLSEFMYQSRQDVQSYEVPTTLAAYARNCNVYVTFAMIALSTVVVVYVVACRGHVEGKNLLKLNRVGALGWVGRPLVIVRSLTAIALLSTASLELRDADGVSFLTEVADPWYTIVLAASEVTWLVEVVSDMALAYTQAYTPHYAMANAWVVWGVTAFLSAVLPVTPTTTVAPTCTAAAVDFQIVCTTATIAIGQSARLYTLVGLVLGCKVIMYSATRWVLRRSPPSCVVDSLFLCAGAKYLFSHDKWLCNDVYYLDQASAVLNGILTLRTKSRVYAIDIKFWRVFDVPLPGDIDVPPKTPLAAAAQYTMPLAMLVPPDDEAMPSKVPHLLCR
ncbi:hypothetical protein ACHHYP_07826 [Achlya hypogyna]|uniref:Uncharacterized protein n=1 Tax=Achlya hypogyna TaxID=1202772 RepID=A0A1V9YQC6_ACHHY|nr:hypothetical protein ACHHYP_07826 [Achlya hypogyna]